MEMQLHTCLQPLEKVIFQNIMQVRLINAVTFVLSLISIWIENKEEPAFKKPILILKQLFW